MTCPYAEICGGCLRRGMSEEQYRETKTAAFRRILSGIKADFAFGEPVFVADGTRRRAAMAFRRRKGKVTLGFNEAASGNVVDCETCALLTPKLNAALPDVRRLLTEVCALPFTERKKAEKRYRFFLMAATSGFAKPTTALMSFWSLTVLWNWGIGWRCLSWRRVLKALSVFRIAAGLTPKLSRSSKKRALCQNCRYFRLYSGRDFSAAVPRRRAGACFSGAEISGRNFRTHCRFVLRRRNFFISAGPQSGQPGSGCRFVRASAGGFPPYRQQKHDSQY